MGAQAIFAQNLQQVAVNYQTLSERWKQ